MRFVDIEKDYEVVERTGNFVICRRNSNEPSYIAFECGYGGMADFVEQGDLDRVRMAIFKVEEFNEHHANLSIDRY